MKKKIWKKVLAIIVAIVLVIGISAGTAILVDKKSVPAMTTVENGLSAYELAVQYGYEGTVQEWLNSLNGKSTYEIAKEKGYTGTEIEWTTSLKATAGKDGVGIKTAAFSKTNELLITLTDGTVLNLGVADGLNGKDGANGKDGVDGKDGADGKDGEIGPAGKDGVSITAANINEEGQLVLTFSDGKIVNLDKLVGINGKDGIGIASSEINANGELVITYTNGQTANLGVVVGAKGEKGEKGDQGAQGEQGIQGEKGDKGDTGAQGQQGIQGEKGDKGDTGAAGNDGVSVTKTEINQRGELVITLSDNTVSNLGVVVGAKGEKGDKGDKGETGETGATGAQGQQGIQGEKGDKGDKGDTGAQGEQGIQGIQGETGAKGDDGVGIETIVVENGTLKITLTNGTVLDLGNIKGDKGDQGEQGLQGEKGDKGDQGEQGLQGEKGDKGDQGVGVSEVAIENDELVITLSNGNVINLGNIKGAKGEKGDKGDTGEQGVSITNVTLTADGELSVTFSSGQTIPLGNIKGADGQDGVGIDEIYIQDGNLYVKKSTDTIAVNLGSIKGEKGDQGIQGEKGEKGDKGDAGRGIVRTEVIDGELWITYSDDVDNPVNVGRVADMNSVTDGDLVYTMLEDGTYSVKAAKTFTTTNLVIPSTYNGITVSKIADKGFENKACIATVSLPNTLTEIGKYAFSGCTGLTTVDIPASVKCIGAFSFYRSGLTTANLSATKWISGNDDFSYMTYSYRYNSNDNLSSSSETLKYYDMTSAENVANALRGSVCVDYISTYRGGKWTYTQRDFYWYAEEWTPLYVTDGVFEYLLLSDMTYAIKGSISAVESTELVIPSQYNGKAVTEILPNGFENFANLETVTIPSSINVIGKYAFKGCASATFVFEEETTYVCDFGYISVYNEDRMSSHYEYVSINASTSNNFTSRYLTYNKYIIRYENYERETINQPLYNATLTKSDS